MSDHDESPRLESLARRLAELDEAAYREFADTLGPRFRAFFLSKRLSVSDAEDLTVSCVTDVVLSTKGYRVTREGGFESWVWSIVRHKFADWCRERVPTVQLDEAHAVVAQPEDAGANPKLVAAVDAALAGLPPADEALIRLRYFGGEYSFSDIGKNLGLNQGAARVRHHRICKRLAELLKRDERILEFLDALSAVE